MGPNINMPTEVEPISLVCEHFHWLYNNSVIHKGRNPVICITIFPPLDALIWGMDFDMSFHF